MAGHQGVLDPRLEAAQDVKVTTPQSLPPARPSSFSSATRGEERKKSDIGVYGAQQSPHPYYHYPSPQTQSPSHPLGAHSSASHSNQASPNGNPNVYPADAGISSHTPDQAADDPNAADDQKRARACEACRGLKVRCDQDPEHPEIPCRRCAKAGRQCIITQPSRKRQKKADSRVAELEKKLDALTAALHHQQYGGQLSTPGASAGNVADTSGHASAAPAARVPYGPPITTSNPLPSQPGLSEPMSGSKRKRSDDTEPEETPTVDGAGVVVQTDLSRIGSGTNTQEDGGPRADDSSISWAPSQDLRRYHSYQNQDDFVRRINSLIQPDLATTIFNRYTNELCPNLPAVVFPPGTTAEQILKEKPILYVCILSAASSGTLHHETSREVTREAIGAIADCVVRSGAKSLELIQAMQVVALWYKPPEKAEATNFYQIVHMAAVMALDIGLGKRFNPTKARRGFGGPNAQYAPGPHKVLPQDSDTLEARRAWLCCYFLCASASMVLRRPNLVRWTNYMKECIEVLESHPDALPTDKLFCQYVKIQHICEDIGLQFLMDDNTATISIKDPKVTYALNVLEGQLKTWKENIPPECRTPGLQFFEHVTALYLHEIALHFNHNIDDFRLPFTEESLKSVNNTSDTLTANQMAALEACLKAAHGVLDTVLSFDLPSIKSLPMLIYFVRCVYAIVILIKMHVAVCTPNSELGKMMTSEDLRVDYYLASLIRLFGHVSRKDGYTPHPKILRILHVLRDWFGKHKNTIVTQHKGGQPPQNAQQQDRPQFNQTPLHLLSQVATNDQQTMPSQVNRPASDSQDWTFDNPSMVAYSRKATDPSSFRTADATQTPRDQTVNYPLTDAYGMPIDQGMVDPMNPDFGWGTGFEQAMDLALGGMDGLQGAGLDDWFLGDSVAPFGFHGEGLGNGGSQQW